jgi:hypothetical protein
MKRKWFQIHLSTAILALLLIATAIHLNSNGKAYPSPIFVYDEISYDGPPDNSWEKVDGMLIPPRQRVIDAVPDYKTFGFPFTFGDCKIDTPKSLILAEIWRAFVKRDPRYNALWGYEPSNEGQDYSVCIQMRKVVYNGLGWLGFIALFCVVREWQLRCWEAHSRHKIAARRNWLRKGLLLPAGIALLSVQAIDRVDCKLDVCSGAPPYSCPIVGVAEFHGRGWPFVFSLSSPIELPMPSSPSNPTIEVDTALNVSAICSDLIVAAIVLLSLHLLCGLYLSVRTARITT